MTLTEFKATLTATTPPAALAAPLLALWHDAKGDWEGAHSVAQDIESADGAWIHAYLHRKEGDVSNAACTGIAVPASRSPAARSTRSGTRLPRRC